MGHQECLHCGYCHGCNPDKAQKCDEKHKHDRKHDHHRIESTEWPSLKTESGISSSGWSGSVESSPDHPLEDTSVMVARIHDPNGGLEAIKVNTKDFIVPFSVGLESTSSGISVNGIGTEFTFTNSGMYRFSFDGVTSLGNKEAYIRLVKRSPKFDSRQRIFAEKKNSSNRVVFNVIVPIEKGSKVSLHILPTQGVNSVTIASGADLQIYRL